MRCPKIKVPGVRRPRRQVSDVLAWYPIAAKVIFQCLWETAELVAVVKVVS